MLTLFLQAEPIRQGPLRQLVQDGWPILLLALVGVIGIYLLMPQPGRRRLAWGALASGVALVAGGVLLIRAEMALAETILFYAFAGIAVVGGVMLITQINPVHAALSFALVVLSTCGLFLLQGAPFLMASTIIVYAGAIVVTFLFVIMLAQQEGQSGADQRSREPFVATLAGFVLLGALLIVLQRNYQRLSFDAYLDKFERASRAETSQEILSILGNFEEIIQDLRSEVPEAPAPKTTDPLIEARRAFWNAVHDASFSLKSVPKLKRKLAEAHAAGLTIRSLQGSLVPSAALPLSGNSGPPRNAVANGEPVRGLPAYNVAALGRSLFTDYLLPVELAGVLLLVATIGAIVIAHRHKEAS
jgi:NADH-quinone oxidoreductase subunit J